MGAKLTFRRNGEAGEMEKQGDREAEKQGIREQGNGDRGGQENRKLMAERDGLEGFLRA